jgi:hypothetical protein
VLFALGAAALTAAFFVDVLMFWRTTRQRRAIPG